MSAKWMLAGLTAIVMVTPAAHAERPPAPKLLPENTLVMVRLHDAARFAELMSDTSVGRMTKDPQIRPLLEHLYGSASEAFVQVEKEIGVSLTDVTKIPSGEICFALIDKGQGNEPGVMVLMDCDDSIEDAERIIDRLIEEATKNGETVRTHKVRKTEVRTVGDGAVAIKDGAVLMTNSLELTTGVIDMWDGELDDIATLSDNKSFSTIMKKCLGAKGERPQATFFVDPMGIVRMATRGNLGAVAMMSLMEPLGIYGIKGVGGSMILGTDEFESIAHAHLLLDEPREGVLKAIAMTSGDIEPQAWVPANVASYTTMHWDVQETYRAIETLFDTVRGEGQMDRMVERRLTDQMGIDFKDELLGQFDGRVTLISWMAPPPKINAQCMMLGIELDDDKKMKKTLETLLEKFPEMMMPDTHNGVELYRFPTGGRRGRGRRRPRAEGEGEGEQRPQREPPPIAELARRPTPCVAVYDGHLLMTDSFELMQAAINAKRSGESLADDLEYKLVEGKIKRHLAGIEPGMLEFTRPEESFKAIYSIATAPQLMEQLARGAETGNPGAVAIHEALKENPLPPFEVLAKYLAPAGAMVADSDTGLHYTAFSLRRDSEEEQEKE